MEILENFSLGGPGGCLRCRDSEQRSKCNEWTSHMSSWDESVPGIRNSGCKGPGVGMSLGCLGKSKEACVAGN